MTEPQHKNAYNDAVESAYDGEWTTALPRERTKKPTYFTSNTQGAFAKNAVTGVEYPWRIGSSDTRRLFRIVDTTGVFDSTGSRLKIQSAHYPNPNPNYCYYDSPQQFMQHRKLTLQPQMVERWQAVQEEFNIPA